jgi:hypothetical protein
MGGGMEVFDFHPSLYCWYLFPRSCLSRPCNLLITSKTSTFWGQGNHCMTSCPKTLPHSYSLRWMSLWQPMYNKEFVHCSHPLRKGQKCRFGLWDTLPNCQVPATETAACDQPSSPARAPGRILAFNGRCTLIRLHHILLPGFWVIKKLRSLRIVTIWPRMFEPCVNMYLHGHPLQLRQLSARSDFKYGREASRPSCKIN